MAIETGILSTSDNYDVVIVGAGAAGMMAAITAAGQTVGELRPRVLLLDSQVKIGAKIVVAGGGRCNVTNQRVDASCFNTAPQDVPLNKSFVARVLRSFNLEQTHRFFDALGVPLKLEETGKYFPVSDSGRTVLNALLGEVQQRGAVLRTGCEVNTLRRVENQGEPCWTVATGAGDVGARTVILCTGGLALPKSGSNGAGFEFARRLGHTIVTTTPALSPLLASPVPHAHLSGITLPVRLTLRDGHDTLAQFTGSFLFTHTGYSGPPALNISRHFAHHKPQRPEAKIDMCLLPDVAEGTYRQFWHDLIKRDAKKSTINVLSALLPRRVAETIVVAAKANGDTPLGKLSPTMAQQIQRELFEVPLPVASVAPYQKAEATAGGVSLDEIDSATMMSRLHTGLFFAGEICDVDGWLGGYNFQWAWSSGSVAGRSAARYALRRSQSRGATNYETE